MAGCAPRLVEQLCHSIDSPVDLVEGGITSQIAPILIEMPPLLAVPIMPRIPIYSCTLRCSLLLRIGFGASSRRTEQQSHKRSDPAKNAEPTVTVLVKVAQKHQRPSLSGVANSVPLNLVRRNRLEPPRDCSH